MTRYSFYLLSLLLLLGISACQPADIEPDINIDISDELQIELWEVLDQSQRMLELRVTTLETLDCENYSISFALNQTVNNAIVSINNIVPPHECISGSAPASDQINLGHFQDGDHAIQLNLRNNEIVNLGKLIVRSDFYQLEMESNYGISIPWDYFKKVPENLIWGYLTINDTDITEQNLVLEAFNNRMDPWTEVIGLSSGLYGYFTIENEIPIAVKDKKNTITKNLFLFKETGTRVELIEAINDLRNEFGNLASINMFLSDGSVL